MTARPEAAAGEAADPPAPPGDAGEAPPRGDPALAGPRRIPRAHRLVLAAVVAVGLVRGLYWSSVTLVFNPIDEHAHFAYVESVARHLRPPVVGEDHLSAEALELAKRTRTSEWRSAPVPPDPSDERWGLVRESYEGVQGPLYYLLMALPYRLASPFGVLTSLYAVRVATVALSLVTVPIAYLLARELFPRRREAWLAAPAFLVLLQGFNGNLGSITNDALVVPLGGAMLLAVARAARTGLTPGNAVCTGALVGLGLCTKSNMVGVAALVAVAAVAVAVARREGAGRLLRWAAVSGLSVVVVSVPWLVWNLVKYGALSASEEVDLITGPLQPHYPFGLDGLRRHLTGAVTGYWDAQVVADTLGRYMWTLSVAALALLAAGAAAALWRRRPGEVAVLGWLASTWFVTVGVMVLVIYALFDGRSSVVGRHLYPALVASVVLVAAAAFSVFGRRAGWLVLLGLANLALTFEQPLVDARVDRDYAAGVIGNLAPVVDQSFGDAAVPAAAVRLEAPCRAEAFALAFVGGAPPELRAGTATGPVAARLTGSQGSSAQPLGVYTLEAPAAGPLEVDLGGALLSASVAERDHRVAIAGHTADPVARVFCAVDDPKAFRFAQTFAPDHPSWISYGAVKGWPTAWAWLGRLALLAATVAVLAGRGRRRPVRGGGAPPG